MAASPHITREEEALIQQALAELRGARPAARADGSGVPRAGSGHAAEAVLPPSAAPSPAGPTSAPGEDVPIRSTSTHGASAESSDVATSLHRPSPAGPVAYPAPAAAATDAAPAREVARHTVFAPAGMQPEMQARIALLMEKEADERVERRARQRRAVMIAAAVGTVVVMVVFVASLGTPGGAKKKASATAPTVRIA